MKKIGMLFFTIIFLFAGKDFIYAGGSFLRAEDVLATSRELEEIKALEEEMRQNIVSCSSGTGKDITFCYEKSIKIHGTDIFALNTDHAEMILNALDNGVHMWVVEAEKNGRRFELQVSKGLPLSEGVSCLTPEDKQDILDHVGKWQVVSCTELTEEYESFFDKVMAQKNALADCEQAVLIHDLPGFQYPVLLGFKNHKASVFAGIGYGYFVMSDYEEEMNIFRPLNSDGERVYGFAEMAEHVQPYYELMEEAHRPEMKNQDFVWMYVTFLAAVLLLAAGKFFLTQRIRMCKMKLPKR